MMRSTSTMVPLTGSRRGSAVIDESDVSLAVGVLAAQVATAGERAIKGLVLDEWDLQALQRAQDLTERAASAVDFGSTLGKTGQAPSNFHAVTWTVEAALRQVSDEQLDEFLNSLKENLSQLRVAPNDQSAIFVRDFFGSLAEYVTRATGGVGETHIST